MTKLNNFKSILFFFLLIGCGFTPILKDFDSSKIKIKEITYTGDQQLTFKLKESLSTLERNKDPNGLIISISVSKSINSVTKNTAGITTEEELSITANFEIKNSEKTFTKDDITSSKRISVTNNLASDQEKRDIESGNLLREISQKIKAQIIFSTR